MTEIEQIVQTTQSTPKALGKIMSPHVQVYDEIDEELDKVVVIRRSAIVYREMMVVDGLLFPQ